MSKLIQKKYIKFRIVYFFYFLFYERQGIVKLIDETLLDEVNLFKDKMKRKRKGKKEEKKRGGINVQKRENNNLH